ncbi:serum response factor a isoform X1 [Gadus macrocephalus]|uniref:serum response factor a isoform X1 n=1 Tax=Gadus macrocephalus TaxID=80720 RepID=UPI0028CB140E|nr:serum response factor a isoform X1 [Gadus macrocephalus]
MGTRAGGGRPGTGASSLQVTPSPSAPMNTEYPDLVYSASEQDSDSGDEEETQGSGGERRGVKRERSERELGHSAQSSGVLTGAYGGVAPGVAGAKPGKKTRGRVKIKMEFIDNKLRRYTTFSKRKTGIMKKAYELSTLTGTQVLLLVASETGHVYTFATRKLQPMITSETGKALIQTCLNSPDSPPRSDPSSDQRMSATGFEETDLTYQVSEAEGCTEVTKEMVKPAFTLAGLQSTVSSLPTSVVSSGSSSGGVLQVQSSIPTHWQGCTSSSSTTNGTLLKTSTSVMLPGGFTLMSAGTPLPHGTHTIPLSQLQGQLQGQQLALQGPLGTGPTSTGSSQPATLLRLPVSLTGGGMSQQLQTIQVQPGGQHLTTNQSSELHCTASTATIVTSSLPSTVASHMMYPGGHTVMYATPTSSLTDGGLTLLNTFSQSGSAPNHEQGQQVFLTSLPPVTQIPVSAVQLHSMVIGQQAGGSSNLTELQVVNMEVTPHSKED